MVTLYSTGCPKCQVLTKKLEKANIQFNVCKDTNIMKEKNINSVPVLEVDGTLYSFKDAAELINRGELN